MESRRTPPSRPPNPALPYREDCWSEGETSVLIDAWGDRYVELNRGNLRQKQWQEVADAVNSRPCDTRRPPRTDVQCKNRIDTLKKKYKAERSALQDRRWRLFLRRRRQQPVDLLRSPRRPHRRVRRGAPQDTSTPTAVLATDGAASATSPQGLPSSDRRRGQGFVLQEAALARGGRRAGVGLVSLEAAEEAPADAAEAEEGEGGARGGGGWDHGTVGGDIETGGDLRKGGAGEAAADDGSREPADGVCQVPGGSEDADDCGHSGADDEDGEGEERGSPER